MWLLWCQWMIKRIYQNKQIHQDNNTKLIMLNCLTLANMTNLHLAMMHLCACGEWVFVCTYCSTQYTMSNIHDYCDIIIVRHASVIILYLACCCDLSCKISNTESNNLLTTIGLNRKISMFFS